MISEPVRITKLKLMTSPATTDTGRAWARHHDRLGPAGSSGGSDGPLGGAKTSEGSSVNTDPVPVAAIGLSTRCPRSGPNRSDRPVALASAPAV